MFDLVIKNATIYDGTGGEGFVSDIGVRDGKIARIGEELSGKETIDAAGLAVSPGWIDGHGHSDSAIFTFVAACVAAILAHGAGAAPLADGKICAVFRADRAYDFPYSRYVVVLRDYE